MKIFEEINNYRKEYVYDIYTRIVSKFKSYDNISKSKMIKEIYKVYEDENNILDICTARELKFLKLYFDNNEEYKDKKYDWERRALRDKFILDYEYEGSITVYEEIYNNLKVAINKINWKESKRKDKYNEFLVSFCKIQGTVLLNTLIQIGSAILNTSEEEIYNHIKENRLFRYYVNVHTISIFNKETFEAYYISYYNVLDLLREQRKKYGKASVGNIDLREFESLFYNDFNMQNNNIKKFYNELINLPILYYSVIEEIQLFALLNLDRSELKDAIKSIPILKDYDLNNFFKLLDKAMDEMKSGALNGLSINELIKLEEKEREITKEKEKRCIKQGNAHLSKKDAQLYYKLYFGLLDFTNKKYNIKLNYSIRKKKGINPYDIQDIVKKFWECKDNIIDEFCCVNPYRFNKEELDIIKGFKKGFRDNFVMVEHTEEYTAFMNMNKVYMIKGITSNIDETISNDLLPTFVETSILPFKGYLIYDGLLMSYPINFGPGFYRAVSNDYNKAIKYYHL